jgi:predicted nucleic acid-binding protein
MVLPFDQRAAAIAAYVFERIGKRKSNEKWGDILIASTVIAHGYGLVSQNRKDFDLIANYLPAGQKLYLTIWRR